MAEPTEWTRPADPHNLNLKGFAIQMTHLDGSDTALLTVRGKDHDLDAHDLMSLADAALMALTGPDRVTVMRHYSGSAKKAVASLRRSR